MATYAYTFQSGDSVTPSRLNDARTVSDIVDADISATAEIAVSKLEDGAARQILQTNAAGTGVEWTDNVDVVGTLDVTGATTLDGTLSVAGAVTTTSTATLAHGVVVTGSSSGNAVRITQEGTGNALLVEDSANPDSTPVVIDASGNTVIGHTSAVSVGGTTQPLTVNGLGATLVRAAADAFGAALRFCKSRSTDIGAARAIVVNGDELGAIEFAADNGANLSVLGASVSAEVDGTAGSADMPSRLLFSTTPDGSDTPVERMRITNGGNVGIGKTPTTKLDVDGTVTATAFAGPLTGNVTGNASTATTLQNSRTIAISGDVTGTATSFDGSSNITISSAITADSIVNADINSSAAIALSKLAAGALPTGITVASANIVDGTIVNADINSSAAIAGTKISPDFGSQSITTTGVCAIGGSTVASNALRVSKGITGSTSPSGVAVVASVASDATSSARGVSTFLGTDASSFTCTELIHFLATQGTFGAGSSVTVQSGFKVGASLTGGTTNVGFNGDIDAAAGRWNFYAGGTAANFFAGQVSVGATTLNGSAALQVTSTTQGFLPPRMTTAQRDGISTPAAGLMVYNTTTNKLNFYNGTAWEAVTSS